MVRETAKPAGQSTALAQTTEDKLPAAATLPTSFMEQAEQDAGKGVSSRAEDNIIPLVYSLQDKSKYCKATGPDFVPGAKAGMLMLRNADEPLVSGTDGFAFQLCHFFVDIVEWRPRASGGGITGRHERIIEKPAAKEGEEPTFALPDGRKVLKGPHPENPRKMIFKLENGNELVETRNHIGYVLLPGKPPMPYSLPMKGADHNVSKTWQTLMNNKVTPSGKPYPSWVHIARVTLKPRSNPSGDWFGYHVALEGFIQSQEEYDRGRALHVAASTGQKRVADEEAGATGETGDGSASETAAM